MKHRSILPIISVACSFLALINAAFGQGTAFTYQGRLNDGGNPANGHYDLRLRIASDPLGNNYPGTILTNNVPISNGLFTVSADFGANLFTGSNYWLEVDVRTNGGSNYTTLNPLQPLTATPYAIYAGSAGNVTGPVAAMQLTGTVPSSALAGVYSSAVTLSNAGNSFVGNGAGLTNLSAWRLSGNAGANPTNGSFLGTTDTLPLEVRVAGVRALRLEYGGVSSIAISKGFTNVNGAPNMIGGAPVNFVQAGAVGAVIAGGGATNYGGTLAFTNSVAADFGTIGGGVQNQIPANARVATIAGGEFNTASGNGSFIGGGGWDGNNVAGNSNAGDGAVIGGGLRNELLNGGTYSVIGGGVGNTNGQTYAVIGGGLNNFNTGSDAAIGGGSGNQTSNLGATIGGGQNNVNSGSGATIGGGVNNVNSAMDGSIGGGLVNQVTANYATVAGGTGNQATAAGATIGGGTFNTNQALNAVIGGGIDNEILASSAGSTIGGGVGNQILLGANGATISGGGANQIGNSAMRSVIGGGLTNRIQTGAQNATIGGGSNNVVSGSFGTIPGGDQNMASTNSFAAGHRAKATDTGSFVWADATDVDFTDAGTNTFNVRASGGVVFSSGSTNGTNQTVSWTPGSGSWSFTSDRNAKENFQPVDARQVLEKVASLPLMEWNYKGYGDRHVGPMAQDFHAAFPFNANDKMLNSADEAGVSLAAIQGLNEKLDEKDAEIQSLRKQNDSLAERLNELETTVKQLASQK
jgi:hypothetical protein